MNKLDELFKEKLSDYSVAPSAGAWQKIEPHLSKKNETMVWVRWAAVLLLGGLLLSALWIQRKDSASPLAKQKQPVPQKAEMKNHESLTPALAEEKSGAKNVVAKKKA